MRKSAGKSKKHAPKSDLEKVEPQGPPFKIRMGLPQMDALWNRLETGHKTQTLTSADFKLFRKWGKALRFLSQNPLYPSLSSHEIKVLTQKYGMKIFEAYLENNTPSAGRMFWTYGPARAEITILALEPHPEEGEYARVRLDDVP